ncbi:MAG: type I DNA topoisomerase [Oscillospiraceae bacterium]|jgi:DNA topoisomerase-1|nr:type I DNA topoisomerase [Oscillospiraceae bacterium]
MSKLVIVESPAKAKTIKKYLGGGYEVIASMGHVRDLPKSKLGVDVENHFEPQYIPMRGKEKVVRELKTAAKKADTVYLATDPDREGEAISWHLAHLLNLDVEKANRITFNEITKTGVTYGMAHPRQINLDLVNAQQARRILDRIVGYKLSPLLWKKIKRGLSAGRVQSVALRLVVDRENEIRVFQPEEYWTIDAKVVGKGSRKQFAARFYGKDGVKMDLHNRQEVDQVLAAVQDKDFIVTNVKKGVRKKSPAPPFTTSTLQQEASRKLGFQAYRTMKAAQELYEGVEVEGMGAVGLITYMRTDSLRISAEAQQQAAEYIGGRYGKNYLPATPKVYKSKGNAQDAHEAIRPSMPDLSPDKVKDSLTADQYKLYKLIWERFIASQMAPALLDTVNVDILADTYNFKASGYSVKFEGFTVLYEESKDEAEEESGMLPPIQKDDVLKVRSIDPAQHYTQPPARYTEASLIKALEENGIGRPSTYAPTISVILQREYVEREQKALKPTYLGEVVNQLMSDNFKNIVDVNFTAKMEKDLDKVEEGRQDWVKTLDSFYKDFAKTLEKAQKELDDGVKIKLPEEETDEVCELCGRKMVVKSGRFGKFLACPGFPECKNTKKIVKKTDGVCPRCGGRILVKRSKNGKTFYGCEKYPQCEFVTWDEPVSATCPKCGASLLRKKGRSGKLYCANEKCDYERDVE